MGAKKLTGAWGPVVSAYVKLPTNVFVPNGPEDRPDQDSSSARGWEEVTSRKRLVEIRNIQLEMAQKRNAAPSVRR